MKQLAVKTRFLQTLICWCQYFVLKIQHYADKDKRVKCLIFLRPNIWEYLRYWQPKWLLTFVRIRYEHRTDYLDTLRITSGINLHFIKKFIFFLTISLFHCPRLVNFHASQSLPLVEFSYIGLWHKICFQFIYKSKK